MPGDGSRAGTWRIRKNQPYEEWEEDLCMKRVRVQDPKAGKNVVAESHV